jgi:hypothetical protein
VEYLLGLLIVLVVVTLVGHGIWVGIAKLVGALATENADRGDTGRFYGHACRNCGESMRSFEDRCPRCGLERVDAREAADLRATLRHLREFHDEGLIDPKRFQLLRNRVEARHRTLTGQPFESPPPPRPARAAVGAPPPNPTRTMNPRFKAEELLSVLPVVETPVPSSAVQKTPLPVRATEPSPPPTPRAPRRTLTEWLAAFMEDRNILWGELVGGLLMVGCSIALVISLWQKIEEIEYAPFLIMAAATAALFGMGHYTLHRWKLPSTSRGLLVIATLLVPLNFTLLAGLSQGGDGGLPEIATKAVAVAVFAWFVYKAGCALLPVEDGDGLARWHWTRLLLPAAVVGTPISQLSVVRFMESGHVGGWFVALTAWPVAWHALSVGGYLGRRAWKRPAENGGALLGFHGLAAFALVLSLSFIGIWTVAKGAGSLEVLKQMALPVAFAAVPTLFTGLFIRHCNSEAQRGSKESHLLVAGTGVALVGMLAMLASLVLAWPNPGVVFGVCLLNFVTFTTVAFVFRLPVAHAPALVCLTLGYLTAFHVGAHNLIEMMRVEDAGSHAVVLVALFTAAMFAAEGLTWKRRHTDAAFYRVGACAIALLSILSASQAGFLARAPQYATWIFGFFAVTAWLLSWGWRWRWLDHVGAALTVGAVLWALQWQCPRQYARWGFMLAAEALLFSLLVGAWWPEVLAALGLALVTFVAPPFLPTAGWHTLSLLCLGATAFVQATRRRSPVLTWIGSSLVLLCLGHAVHFGFEALVGRFREALLANAELNYVRPPVPLLATLLIHATLAQAAAWLIRHRRPQYLTAFAIPLGQSALASLLLAIPFLFAGIEREEMAVRAIYSVWLAGLWLAQALVERRTRLFPVFQIAVAVSVLFGVAGGLMDKPWVIDNYPLGLLNPRSLQTFGLGLAALSLLWGVARLTMQPRAAAQKLFEALKPNADRFILGLLVIGQALMAIWCLIPGLAMETAPNHLAIPLASGSEAFGRLGWMFWSVLGLTLAVWLWEARTPVRVSATIMGLVLLALTAPVLTAGQFNGEAAAASALRWSLAASFLAASVPLWWRITLGRNATRWGIGSGTPGTADSVRGVLLAAAALPVVALSIWMAVVVFMGLKPGGPGEGSFFHRVGDFTSHLLPLGIVLVGLTGHALREWSEEHAFAGGLVTLMIVMGGYALGVLQASQHIVWDNWVILLQAGTIAAALWAIGWIEVVARLPRGIFGATRRSWSLLPTRSLLRVQVLMVVLGSLILSLLTLPRLLADPGNGNLRDHLLPFGQVGGWLAFTAGLLAVLSYARRFQVSWEPHVWGGAMVGAGVLAACTMVWWEQGNWLAYHTLMVTWTLAAWALGIAAGWSTRAAPRFEERITLWMRILYSLVVGLAIRAAWGDPGLPYFSSTAVLAVALLGAAVALRRKQVVDVVLAGILFDLAGVLAWIKFGPHTSIGFLSVNILCIALASIGWTVVERVRLIRSSREDLILDFTRFFRHGAALGCAVVMVAMSMVGFLSLADPNSAPLTGALTWCTWSAAALAAALCLWDAGARFPLPALYSLGLTAIVILLQGGSGAAALLARVSMLSLAAYVLAITVAAHVARVRPSWMLGMRLPWPFSSSEAWFLPAQALVASIALALSLGVTLAQDTASERFTGPAAIAIIMFASAVLAELATESQRRPLRVATFLLGVLLLIESGWALFDPSVQAIGLHRSAAVLIGLAISTIAYAFAFPQLLRRNPWTSESRRIAPFLGLTAFVAVALVIVLEGLTYRKGPPASTPLDVAEIIIILPSLVGLILAGICFAVAPWSDPFSLSEQRRPLYVYASELLLVFLFLHLKLNDWFFHVSGKHWTFIVMAIAFIGVGLSEFFQRRKLNALAGPLRRTGIFLPLLPLAAFWLNPPTVIYDRLVKLLPGAMPFLDMLKKVSDSWQFDLYGVLWFLFGALYAILAVTQRKFRPALFAALAANVGLWMLCVHNEVSFFIHPQVWLIPLTIIILLSEVVNRDHLSKELSAGLRYIGLSMLYISSTADLFIAGLGRSAVLPLVLASLSVLGVLAGMLFRVRSYLYLGVAFLVLVIVSMIWHAAVDLQQAWVWWASGIALGAAILGLFALFEKRRQLVLHLVEDFRGWH